MLVDKNNIQIPVMSGLFGFVDDENSGLQCYMAV